jgi:hypothetical protein
MVRIADRLEELARRVDRLIPLRRDPDAFHEEKSEIAAQLRQVAKEVRT